MVNGGRHQLRKGEVEPERRCSGRWWASVAGTLVSGQLARGRAALLRLRARERQGGGQGECGVTCGRRGAVLSALEGRAGVVGAGTVPRRRWVRSTWRVRAGARRDVTRRRAAGRRAWA
jgi:hypothetical protein